MKKTILPIALILILSTGLIVAEETKKTDAAQTAAIDTTQVIWMPYDQGVKLAKETGKHMVVNFTTSWCGYCKKMNREVFSQKDVIKFMNENFVCTKVDGDSKNELDIDGYKISEKNLSRAEFRVSGYPTYWFLKSNGDRIAPLSGFKPKEQFMEVLYYVGKEIYADTTLSFNDYVKNGGRKAYMNE